MSANELSRDSQEVAEVTAFLGRYKFDVQRLPECSEYKTPDLLAVSPESRLVVEVKSKRQDDQLSQLLRQSRGTSRPYRGSPIETSLRGGCRQLREWPCRKPDDFTLIWYCTARVPSARVPVPEIVAGTLEALLFGIETLEGRMERDETFYQKPCFYFHYSFFWRHKELDAVVIENGGELQLCVNNFSDGYRRFRSSRLYKLFAAAGRLIDPIVIEKRGECFVLDSPHPRGDRNKSVQLLREKYGLGRPTIYTYSLVNYSLD
jgi:hypothetical protein